MKPSLIILFLIIAFVFGFWVYIKHSNNIAIKNAQAFCGNTAENSMLDAVISKAKEKGVRIVFTKNGLSSGTISTHQTILPDIPPDKMRLFFPAFFKCNAHCDYAITNNIAHNTGVSFACD